MNTPIQPTRQDKARNRRRAARALAAAGLFGAAAALAQPYKGDLSQYETRTAAAILQDNLLLIIDTSGSMQRYLAEAAPSTVTASDKNVVDIRRSDIWLRKRGTNGGSSRHWIRARRENTELKIPTLSSYKANNKSLSNFCGYFHGAGRPSAGGSAGHDMVYIGSNPHRSSNHRNWRPGKGKPINHPIGPPNEVYLKNDDSGKLYVCRLKAKTMTDAIGFLGQNVSGLNLGLMRYNRFNEDGRASEVRNRGGTVVYHVQSLKEQADRDKFLDVKNKQLGMAGTTPLAESLAEAYRYFKGDTARYARNYSNTSRPETKYTTDPDSFRTLGRYTRRGKVTRKGTYKSPIESVCQSNYIAFLSDGRPTWDTGGGVASSCEAKSGDLERGNSCLDDIAEKLANEDLISTLDGKQSVTTYTVGFDVDFPLLKTTADKGKGQYYTANNYRELLDALKTIVKTTKKPQLVAPSVSVNRFNRLQHRTDFYYATFDPGLNPAWEGNVKRYKLKDGKVFDASNPPAEAVDPNTGLFKETARSAWLDSDDPPDGPVVKQGGYRAELTNTRTLYLPAALFQDSKTGITQVASNDKLKPASFGLGNDTQAATLRNWLLGIDVDDYDGDNDKTDAHRYASDSLHTSPFVVTYAGTESAPRDILFVTTNLGALRAINASDGEELWSYIPTELAKNANIYRTDDPTKNHWDVYGLDGQATLWVTEPTSVGTGSTRKVDKVRLYQGMRRGGRSVYAWDLSNADKDIGGNSTQAPIAELWKITGGSTSGFSDLGYTWSKMLRTRLRYDCESASGCTTKDVLVFSGGYDAYYDTATNAPKTSATGNTLLGRAVYIVDALTGAKLWSAGPAGSADNHNLQLPIHNSVPGDPAVLDVDGDGDLDMLYFVDISGAVFRVDFDHDEAFSAMSTGGQVADLGETSVFRRFYNGPDVALFAERRDPPYLTVGIGSGYRANPIDELKSASNQPARNRFYVLEDKHPAKPARFGGTGSNKEDITYEYVETRDSEGELTGRDLIKVANLHKYVADNPATTANEEKPYSRNSGKHGFYRELDAKEKVLQTSTTFDGDILMTSYLPEKVGGTTTTVADQCSAQSGEGRLYKFSANTGTTTFVINRPNQVNPTPIPYKSLLGGVIPPEPSVLLVPEPVVCVGRQCFENLVSLDEIGKAERVYWREKR